MRALIYDSYEELVEKIVADKQVKPEDFYYLGFHFAEESEQMGQFGVRMLQHLVETFPRSQICPQAEQKLKLHLPEEPEEQEEEVTKEKPSRKKAASKRGSSKKAKKASGKKKSGSSRRVTINVSASTSAARKAKSPRKKTSKS